jgi:hypothetical protein
VTLIVRDPVICGVWKFLQRSSPKDIMRLPVDIDTIDDIPRRVCQEARQVCSSIDLARFPRVP